MHILTAVGILLVIALIIGVGIRSGKKVKTSNDFLSGGGKAGSLMVCGAIMGSLVSSQSTIGTVQLAFNYGLAAWWYTLGAGIGCLFLGIGYVKSLRSSGCITEFQIISKEYGPACERIGSILCSIGIFLSVIAQILSCTGLVTALFPSVPMWLAAVVSIALMLVYVIFGGAWGAGMGGVVKLFLLYAASVIGLFYVLSVSGGIDGLLNTLEQHFTANHLGDVQEALNLPAVYTAEEIRNRFMNLMARGPLKDIGSAVSLLFGVLSTQTYAQAIWSAKTDAKARKGAFLSALLIPPIGAACVAIGMYMRAHYITAAEAELLTANGVNIDGVPILASTIQAFPQFVIDNLNPLVAGIILGTLFITVVGGGAGLSFGVATILVKDIFKKISTKINTSKRELATTRVTIFVVLCTAATIAILIPGTIINDIGFLSMGLRGTVVFVPMSAALYLKGKVNPKAVMVSLIVAPLTVIVGKILGSPIDPLFIGIGFSALCVLVGCIIGPSKKQPVLQ